MPCYYKNIVESGIKNNLNDNYSVTTLWILNIENKS